MINRRKLITGLISLAAAPAIVRAQSLMSVKVIKPDMITLQEFYNIYENSRLDILFGQMTDLIMFGSSLTRIAYDESSPYGIVLTPIRNHIELDKSISSDSMEQFKKGNFDYVTLRKDKR